MNITFFFTYTLPQFIALAWSWLSFYLILPVFGGGWEELTVSGDVHMSWAGTVAELFSNPVFLVFLWGWRFLIWSLLLERISRLPLNLTPLHPDRAGGLLFLALFPGMFNGFVLALSCVGASSLIKTLALVPQSQQFIWFAIGGWVLLMALVFLAPLLLFIRPLYLARERALIEYGKLAQIHHQAFHEIWISGG